MSPFQGNLPDQVWSRLKQWAKTQAGAQLSPTNDECVAQVCRITVDITGRADGLRREVISFYADETVEMIAKFRAQSGPAGALDFETAV